MAQLVNIKGLKEYADRDVNLRGWVYGRRSGGKIVFLLVRDGTGLCQCVVEAQQEDVFATAANLGQESSLELTGRVRLDERSPGGCEVAVHALRILQAAEDYPITRKAHGTDFLLNNRHLWLRSPRQTTLLRIRHTLIRTAREFFDRNGFTLIDTPILSPGAAEGAGSLFSVDYFGDEVYLAQTGQLYLESACMALGKVYCFGPTFRAEKSKTRRHLTEFWMVEPEIAFAELDDLVACAEDLVCFMVERTLEAHREDLLSLGRDLAPLEHVSAPFPRITYTEAVDLLHSPEVHTRLQEEQEEDQARLKEWMSELDRLEEEKASARKAWQQDKLEQQIRERREHLRELEADLENRPRHIEQARTFEWGKDLGGAEETILSRRFEQPVFVTEYPRAVKAFYMKMSPTDPRVVLNMDLLAPEGYGEIIGGSQREDHLERLEQRMAEEQMDPEPYQWYLDLRRYGSVPHGGFGLGIERTVGWVCGIKHVREAIPFPRLMGRMYP